MGAFFADLFAKISTASFSFGDIGTAVRDFFATMLAEEHFGRLLGIMNGYLESVAAYIPFVLLALYALLVLFGKKLFPLVRFLAFFSVGFALGVYFLSGLVLGMIPTMPTWVIGVVIGIVAGVLSKLLYILAYIAAGAYSVYFVCYTALIPALEGVTGGNMTTSVVVAGVAVILLLVLRKYVEMLGTAMLGGFGIATVVRTWYDFTTISVFVGREWLGMLAATLVIALVGFVIQFKTRTRY